MERYATMTPDGITPSARDRACLAHASVFQDFDERGLDDLLARCRVFEQPAGGILCRDGEPARSLYLLVGGIVQLYRGEHAARHAVLHVVRPGESFGEPAAMVTGRQPLTAEAVTDVRVVEVPANVYWRAVFENPHATIDVIGMLTRRLMTAWDTIEALQTSSTTDRLAKYLLGYCKAKDRSAAFDLPFDKGLLAASLGMKPESLSRAFAKLRHLGVESRRRRVVVRDPRRLAASIGVDKRVRN